MVGDMLAYAMETNTFAVGVGDGMPVGELVGDAVAEGDGLGTAIVPVACVQPPVAAIASAAAAQAANATIRSVGKESGIEGNPFSTFYVLALRASSANSVRAFAAMTSYVISPSTASRMTPSLSTKKELGKPCRCRIVPSRWPSSMPTENVTPNSFT